MSSKALSKTSLREQYNMQIFNNKNNNKISNQNKSKLNQSGSKTHRLRTDGVKSSLGGNKSNEK